jgi:DNA polymerase III epsilon subunit-like protein
MAMYLFFDSETSGLPRDWNAPVSQVENWPRVVELAWSCCDADGNLADTRSYLIRPDGFVISPGAAAVHGITTERARAEGVALPPVLGEFAAAVQAADLIVAHNLAFDENVVGAEFLRAGLSNALAGKRRFCTMKSTTDLCRIPSRHGFKWPSLVELHRILFGQDFAGSHGARADCDACARCFFALRERGLV